MCIDEIAELSHCPSCAAFANLKDLLLTFFNIDTTTQKIATYATTNIKQSNQPVQLLLTKVCRNTMGSLQPHFTISWSLDSHGTNE